MRIRIKQPAVTNGSLNLSIGDLGPIRVLFQPRFNVFTHRGNHLMGGIIIFELNILGPQFKPFFVVCYSRRRIILISRSRKMEDCGPGWPVIFASLPVPRKPAANSNQTLKMIRMGEGEAVVKRARLREAKQKYS